MRAFIAVNLEQHIQIEIEQIQREMEIMTRGFRWVSRELLHITLKYLGDINRSTVSNISRAMGIVSHKHAPFTLSFTGMGAFPTLKRPRVIWIGLGKGAIELAGLALDIDKALKKNHEARENGRDIFKPHITIGRAKKNETAYISQDALSGAWHCAGTLSVDGFFLMESTLTPSGPVYRPVRKFLLK